MGKYNIKYWHKIDNSLDKLGNWIIVIILLIFLWSLMEKQIVVKYMMYEDYYNKTIRNKQNNYSLNY